MYLDKSACTRDVPKIFVSVLNDYSLGSRYFFFFSKNISIYAILNDQSFIGTLINDIVSFEQLGSELNST